MLPTDRVFIIAEAGVNHDGSVDDALRMIDVAAEAGADAVKFQTFSADRLASAAAEMAEYQVRNLGTTRSQHEMLRTLELSEPVHHKLFDRCRARRIAFMSTAFDLQSLEFLASFDVPAFKIASGDLTCAPLILAAASLNRPLILSTGMANLQEIEEALGVVAFGLLNSGGSPSRAAFRAAFSSVRGQAALSSKVSLLHCVTEYPALPADVNLRAIETLKARFGLRTGYSDHTLGIAVALAAVANGASIIEKHFTLDRRRHGPDHRASLEPVELQALVRGIREIEAALGDGRKIPRPAEQKNIPVARRSLVAARPIRSGERFTEANLTFKRPGTGRPPLDWWELMGQAAARDYAADEMIDP